MRGGTFAALAALAVILDATVASEITILGARPDLLVLVIVYGSLLMGGRAAIAGAFIMGIFADSQMPEYLGLNTLALTVVAYATAGVWDHLVKTNVMVQCAVILVATLLRDFIYYLIYYRNHMDMFFDFLLRHGIIGAAYTAAFGVLVYAVARLRGWRVIAGGNQW